MKPAKEPPQNNSLKIEPQKNIRMNVQSITVDYIGSVATPCQLSKDLHIADYLLAQEGYCVAVEVLEHKEVYNQIECTDEVFRNYKEGDVFVGVLGARQALKGYSGRVPKEIEVGDELNVLNMGGIIGNCISILPELGPALRVRVLGAVVHQHKGQWRHVRIQDFAVPGAETLAHSVPLVVISGTSMNTGKTFAAAEIVRQLTEKGYRVAAAKLTGASLMRDTRAMREGGAVACHTFTDAGIVTSSGYGVVSAAKGLIQHLNSYDPDVIVAELGDGFIGYYGVDDLLLDKEIQRFVFAHVVATTDLVGAWASCEIFRERYGAEISVMLGPVTDNEVGKRFIRQTLGVDAFNAVQDTEELGDLVEKRLKQLKESAK